VKVDSLICGKLSLYHAFTPKSRLEEFIEVFLSQISTEPVSTNRNYLILEVSGSSEEV
jgi:hypothetical protein